MYIEYENSQVVAVLAFFTESVMKPKRLVNLHHVIPTSVFTVKKYGIQRRGGGGGRRGRAVAINWNWVAVQRQLI